MQKNTYSLTTFIVFKCLDVPVDKWNISRGYIQTVKVIFRGKTFLLLVFLD